MNITSLIVERRLQEALRAMKPIIDRDVTPWELKREYQDISSTYAFLLDYFRQGVDDPDREKVFTRLCGKTLVLHDKCAVLPYRSSRGAQAGDPFGEASFWTVEEVSSATTRLRSANERTEALCLLVSDVTVSLLRVFDPAKIAVLCEAACSERDAVAVRAVTAIAIVVRRYHERFPLYPDVKARLRHLATDTAFMDMLSDVELQFIRCRDTEKIERQMKDDIIPSMLRSPGAMGKTIVTTDDLTDGSNPEWEKWLKESGLEDSLRELTEMQMNGADVYMATFSSLKNYPFFHAMANWFRPFDPTHPEVAELFDEPATDGATRRSPLTLQRLVMKSGIFCNSDKYSFCLTLKTLPRQQLDLLRTQMAEQEEALRDELGGDLPTDALGHVSPRTLVRQYIQDLYRFFHLYPGHGQFADPFTDGGNMDLDDPLHTFYPFTQQALLAALELNLQRHDYSSAIDGFDLLQATFPDAMDATLWQKCGYCHQQSGRYFEATEDLVCADLLKPGHYWTLLHLAQCYAERHMWEEALDHYRLAAAIKPDNLKLDYQQARCLFEMNRNDEALPILFKLVYHDPDSLKIQRLLIHTLLLLHRPEQAQKYAGHVLADASFDLTDEDLHLLAATQWLCGDRPAALRSLSALDTAPNLFLLASLGISKPDLPFLRDSLIESSL